MEEFLLSLAQTFKENNVCQGDWLTDQADQHNIRRTVQRFPNALSSWIEVTGCGGQVRLRSLNELQDFGGQVWQFWFLTAQRRM